jgi:hypothetical protein
MFYVTYVYHDDASETIRESEVASLNEACRLAFGVEEEGGWAIVETEAGEVLDHTALWDDPPAFDGDDTDASKAEANYVANAEAYRDSLPGGPNNW